MSTLNLANLWEKLCDPFTRDGKRLTELLASGAVAY